MKPTKETHTEYKKVEYPLIHIYNALQELATEIGHSNTNPISLSLLCLGLEISFDEKGHIMAAFSQILHTTAFEDLRVQHFRKALEDVMPRAKNFADSVVIALIKAYAHCIIEELRPFAEMLVNDNIYPISEAFHNDYYALYDQLVVVTLKDGTKIEGGFADEFFEDETIMINLSMGETAFLKISDIEKMELSEKN